MSARAPFHHDLDPNDPGQLEIRSVLDNLRTLRLPRTTVAWAVGMCSIAAVTYSMIALNAFSVAEQGGPVPTFVQAVTPVPVPIVEPVDPGEGVVDDSAAIVLAETVIPVTGAGAAAIAPVQPTSVAPLVAAPVPQPAPAAVAPIVAPAPVTPPAATAAKWTPTTAPVPPITSPRAVKQAAASKSKVTTSPQQKAAAAETAVMGAPDSSTGSRDLSPTNAGTTVSPVLGANTPTVPMVVTTVAPMTGPVTPPTLPPALPLTLPPTLPPRFHSRFHRPFKRLRSP